MDHLVDQSSSLGAQPHELGERGGAKHRDLCTIPLGNLDRGTRLADRGVAD